MGTLFNKRLNLEYHINCIEALNFNLFLLGCTNINGIHKFVPLNFQEKYFVLQNGFIRISLSDVRLIHALTFLGLIVDIIINVSINNYYKPILFNSL